MATSFETKLMKWWFLERKKVLRTKWRHLFENCFSLIYSVEGCDHTCIVTNKWSLHSIIQFDFVSKYSWVSQLRSTVQIPKIIGINCSWIISFYCHNEHHFRLMFIIYAKKRWARKNSLQPTFNPIEMCVTWNDNDKEKNMGNSNSGKQQKKTKTNCSSHKICPDFKLCLGDDNRTFSEIQTICLIKAISDDTKHVLSVQVFVCVLCVIVSGGSSWSRKTFTMSPQLFRLKLLFKSSFYFLRPVWMT